MKLKTFSIAAVTISALVIGGQSMANLSASVPATMLPQSQDKCECPASIDGEDTSDPTIQPPPVPAKGLTAVGSSVVGTATLTNESETQGRCDGPGCTDARDCSWAMHIAVTVTGAGPNDPDPDHIRVGGTDFAFPPGAYPITATSTSKVIDANCGGTVKGKATVRASDDTILAKVSFTAICGDCDA